MGAWVMLTRARRRTRCCAAEAAPRESAGAGRAHGDRDADLQRGRADRVRRPARHLRVAAPRTGAMGGFDFFVLSDTNQPDIKAAEQAAWTDLVRRCGRPPDGLRRSACTTAGASAGPSARPATSPTSAAAGAATTAT